MSKLLKSQDETCAWPGEGQAWPRRPRGTAWSLSLLIADDAPVSTVDGVNEKRRDCL